MKIAVVGTGYVGLVTGTCLADLGHRVTCIDTDLSRVEQLGEGSVPFYEPGLEALLRANLGRNLFFVTKGEEAVLEAEVVFVAVGTPSRLGGGIDLSQVETALEFITDALGTSNRRPIVVIKSTVVPGTTERTLAPALHARGFGDLPLVVNPEFLTEGTAVEDFQRPDRIVVGARSEAAAATVAALYQSPARVISTKPSTAEMIKYASNTLLATMISFANEIADLGERLGDIDAQAVMRGVHASRYLSIGGEEAPITSFLEAGCGFGGSCLPKDTQALVETGRGLGQSMPLLEAVLKINQQRAAKFVARIESAAGDLASQNVSVLGLAFKPDTDDVRASPSFPILRLLLSKGARVVAHDPVVEASSLPDDLRNEVEVGDDLEKVVADADIVVIVTRWDEYRTIPEIVARVNPEVLVADGRRLVAPDSVSNYVGVGWS